MVNRSFITMGIQSLLKDRGTEARVHMYTDSSVAKGIASRKGLGKVRRIEVNRLWLQDKVHEGVIIVKQHSGNAQSSWHFHQACYCKMYQTST